MSDDITPRRLKERLDRGEAITLLDVRPSGEVARFRVDTAVPPQLINVPYTRMLAEADDEDLAAGIAAWVSANLADQLPRDRPVVAVCAKGGASAYVAEGLRRLGFRAVNLAGGIRAWGGLVEFRLAATDADLSVHQAVRPARGCLSYIVAAGGEAVIVDPLRDIEPYLHFASSSGHRIVRVLDTHAHADHVSGGPALAAGLGVPYGLHPYDGIHPVDGVPAVLEYEPLWEGWSMALGGRRVDLWHLPGHTLGNCALRVDDRFLLAGDTLFLKSVARPDLGGRPDAWAPLHAQSLQRLAALPGDTVVLPGHCASPAEADEQGLFAARLDTLRASNEPFRRAISDPQGWVESVIAGSAEIPPTYLEIKRVNLGLATPEPSRLEELEIGRNLCALSASTGVQSAR